MLHWGKVRNKLVSQTKTSSSNKGIPLRFSRKSNLIWKRKISAIQVVQSRKPRTIRKTLGLLSWWRMQIQIAKIDVLRSDPKSQRYRSRFCEVQIRVLGKKWTHQLKMWQLLELDAWYNSNWKVVLWKKSMLLAVEIKPWSKRIAFNKRCTNLWPILRLPTEIRGIC